MLTRIELASLIERLIDALDASEPDPDLAPNGYELSTAARTITVSAAATTAPGARSPIPAVASTTDESPTRP